MKEGYEMRDLRKICAHCGIQKRTEEAPDEWMDFFFEGKEYWQNDDTCHYVCSVTCFTYYAYEVIDSNSDIVRANNVPIWAIENMYYLRRLVDSTVNAVFEESLCVIDKLRAGKE
jgi:hypothetical protein